MSASTTTRGASSKLFQPLSIAGGTLSLKHRVIMAPMTRNRGVPLTESTSEILNRIWAPDALMAEYYGQRATDGGLIVTESILPSLEAGAMPGVPGMWLPEHLEGWKLVTKAVHDKGGIIYAQLTHHGRAALQVYSSLPTVSASASPFSTDEKYAYPPPGKSYNERVFLKDYPPIALTPEHLQSMIADHVAAAKMAIEAGFDGVEIHGGNGYLVEQFLSSNVNVRTDAYGGSPEKRCKFALELVEKIGEAIGIQKVAVRLSPFGTYGDMHDSQRWETWSTLCKKLKDVSKCNLSYVSFVEARKEDVEGEEFENSWGKGREVNLGWARDILGPQIKIFSAGVWDGETVWEGVERGEVDGFAFARWFVSNPDLVERLRGGRELSMYNRGKFYGPTSKREVGYTDYLTWEEIEDNKVEDI